MKEEILEYFKDINLAYNDCTRFDTLKRMLGELEQEPKTGHWIEHEKGYWSQVNEKGERDGWIPMYECSECGSQGWMDKENYCPNCGAKMSEGGER